MVLDGADLLMATDRSRDVHHIEEPDFLGLGLTSRKNLCVHESASKEKKGKSVDARCRDMTNATARAKHDADPESTELCKWHEVSLIYSVLEFVMILLS